MTLVKNINGSSDNYPPKGYNSWKELWEERKNRKFAYCSCVTCTKRAEVGGHVKKVYGSNEWYIVPICTEHNNHAFSNPYTVRDEDLLRI